MHHNTLSTSRLLAKSRKSRVKKKFIYFDACFKTY